MSKKIRYTLIASILITLSILLLPGSHAQRGETAQADDGAITKSANDLSQNPSGGIPEGGLEAKSSVAQDETGTATVLVELTDAPAAVVYAAILAKSPAGAKDKVLLAEAVQAAKTQSALIVQRQATLSAVLHGPKFNVQELYRVHRALNGIAVLVDASKVNDLRKLAGVKSVRVIQPEFASTSTSVPFIGAPQVWGGPLGVNVKGDGIRIGIIDTGIDYQHATFGSSHNTLADYQANLTVVAPDSFFPTAKVVGGTDFVGDDYTASAPFNVPHPDPDPMDCNGHGTHVSGIAAGFGVKNDGTTYTGPFTDSVDYTTLRIGPGAAPGALLYGLRVFGCKGSTTQTVSAIDWAIDPNHDGDFSDHLDVINMSLGGLFGTVADTSAAASDNAALAGVIVVTSAGNSGDTFFINGSPGVASRAISTAASVDNGIAGSGVRVNTPPGIAGFYNAVPNAFGNAPPPGGVTADVVVALDPADGAGPTTTDACSPLTNPAAVNGKIAIVDRGTCNVIIKVKNAQDAGAVGVLVANNVAGPAVGFSGTDPTVVIPSVGISQADGNTFKANIPGLNVTLLPGGDTLASFSSRGARLGLSPSFTPTSSFQLKPDISAPGLSITSAQTGVTCTTQPGCTGTASPNGFQPGSQALTISGTSMASPHIAGVMALLKQLHPDWSVEELKALVMNGAIHDITTFPGGGGSRFGPSRIGSGRVDAPNSATLPVVAFNAEEPGLVSLSFDSSILSNLTQTKTLRVVNNGSTPQTYDLAIDTVQDAAGVSFSLPGPSTINVPAGGSVNVSVLMTAVRAAMDHTRDPTQSINITHAAPLSQTFPRAWLTEEGGYVTFKQGGNLKLRVPIYSAPRAASDMSAPAVIPTGGAPTGSTTIPLTGIDVCTGTLAPGPTCTGTFPNDEESLVTPFELQAMSPRDPVNADGFADIQYVGVARNGSTILFGLTTWEKWSTPTDVSFSVYIDNNNDGTYDKILFSGNHGRVDKIFGAGANQDDTDAFISYVATPTPGGVTLNAFGTVVNGVGPESLDTALFNSRVMFMGASAANLGLPSANAPFRYKVETCPGFAPLCQQVNGFHEDTVGGTTPLHWIGGAQGLNFSSGILFEDLNGASIPVTWNAANMLANGSLGALLLHTHNVDSRQAEVMVLETALGSPNADLAITYTASPTPPSFGQNTTLTINVANNGPNDATGVEVSAPLPVGLTYVSDDGGGAYNPATGQWTVGALNNGANKTLHIVVRVDTTDVEVAAAQITNGSPLDTNPANNQATVTVSAPRSADIALAVSASTPTANVGDSVTFTFKVTNNGDDPAFNVNTTITFPGAPGLVPTSSTATKGSYNSATGIWSIASLDTAASATLTLVVTVPQVCPALVAQATVTSDQADPIPANNTGSATVTVNEAAATFNSATYTVSEGGGHATITVIRAVGCTTGPLTVEYETSDASGLNNCDVVSGNASQRCDYTTAAGTLNFAAGQASATFDVPIIDDVYVEGPETLTLTLFNPAGVTPGTPTTATLTITDNDASPGAPNPIDNDTFFIRQQYLDILGREPDAPGLAGWQAFLSSCAAGSTACDRIELSSRFFRSAEFFDRAYFIYRFYVAGLGRKPTYAEYQSDFAMVAGFLTPAELEARKAAFAEDFSHRPEFKAKYDSKKDGDEYVNAIVATAGVTPSNRTDVAIREGALQITRGQALRELLESPEISAKFFNEAFVVVGYFAYLRRDPDAQYLVWLNQLNTTGNYRDMIGGFIGSPEYRHRFGP
jgi:uncharacterized repeat protein (TIGR01451 family)